MLENIGINHDLLSTIVIVLFINVSVLASTYVLFRLL
jgi:hypothetical protein